MSASHTHEPFPRCPGCAAERAASVPDYDPAKCRKCGGAMTDDPSSEWVTLVGWSAPPGHVHDSNCHKRTATCGSCGAEDLMVVRNACPACDWRGKEKCFVCGVVTIDRWPSEAKS